MIVIIALLGVGFIIASLAYSRKKIESSSLRFVVSAIAVVGGALGASYLGGQFGGAIGAADTIQYMIFIAIGFAILKAIFFRKSKAKDSANKNATSEIPSKKE